MAARELVPVTPWAQVTREELAVAICDEERTQILQTADNVLRGSVRLGRARTVETGTPPQWYRDPFTGRTAPFRWFTDVPYLNPAMVGDHKGTWELSRLQWILVLAQAWKLTGEARYLAGANALLDDWFHRNPLHRGINWTSALEASFRAVTLVAFLHLAGETHEQMPEPRVRRIVGHIEEHARFISAHLSTWFAPNTHLTGEALGLLVIGTAWPAMRDARAWVETSWAILTQESVRQLRPDGSYFEQSSWYLAYTVDFYVEAMAWGRLSGRAFGDDVITRVRRAAGLLRAFFRPDGDFIPIGDDDGGSLWRLSHVRPLGPWMTAMSAAHSFSDAGLLPDAPPFSTDNLSPLVWLHGAGAADHLRAERSAAKGLASSLRAEVFVDGGTARIEERDPHGRVSHALVFDAGPHGAYGHSHDDPLSFDLSVGGAALVVDPGTASYSDSRLRSGFRNAIAHATLRTSVLPHAVEAGPFGWSRRVDARLLTHGAVGDIAWVAGEVTHTADVFAGHRRLIVRVRARAWLVIDLLDQPAANVASVEIGLPLAADTTPTIEGATVIVRRHDGVAAGIVTDGTQELRVSPAQCSPEYGVVVDSQRVTLAATVTGDAAWCCAIAAGDATSRLVRTGSFAWAFHDSAGAISVRCGSRPAANDVGNRNVTWSIELIAADGTSVQEQQIAVV